MSRRKIIIDCDPGHDDAIAILMGARHPKLELLGVTTVRGNQPLDVTTNNALNICQWLDIDVPVCAGLERAIVRPSPIGESIMVGSRDGSGLDGHTFGPQTKKADPRHAVNFIIDTLRAERGRVTLVPTGPLSNIAMAIRLAPDILPKIEEIVLMGGCYQLGNFTPAAEFNIYADAEAAHMVFTCGRPVTMMGLDITRKALCLPSVTRRMGENRNRAAELFVDLMTYFTAAQQRTFGWEGAPLHDPTCIAYLIDPGCIRTQAMYTDIDISGGPSHGRTNCDFFHLSGKPENAAVAVDIDVPRFWDIVESCIRCYNG
ncbi:MAG: nucleoside hydrolase [Oscillospiraceae bacterium]|nr:nucleoside hydrolase [Oscillospiraceae bacterium]